MIKMAMALLGLSVGPVAAQTSDCAAIEDPSERLACYDGLAGRSEPQRDRGWDVRSERSKMTDDEDVFLSLRSEEAAQCGWRKAEPVMLHVQCVENTTSIEFRTDCHMASSNDEVTYRVDRQKPRTVSMDASPNNLALGLWQGGRAIPLIGQLLGRERLVVRMTPYGENPITVSFDIAGIDEAIKPLRQACHW